MCGSSSVLRVLRRDVPREHVAAVRLDLCQPLDQRRRADHPAHAHPRRHDLRKCARIDHEARVVQCIHHWDARAGEPQIEVGIVFHHRDAVLLCQGEDALSPLQRGRHAGGVLEGWNRVDEFGLHALRLQFRQPRAEHVQLHPLIVHRDTDHLRLVPLNMRTAPCHVGSSLRITSPGLSSASQTRSIACDAPAVMRTFSGPTTTPLSRASLARNWSIRPRYPWALPYCNAHSPFFSIARAVAAAMAVAGRLFGSGKPTGKGDAVRADRAADRASLRPANRDTLCERGVQ